MNYTENYHLPQWEETDRIMRTDFNAAMGSLDSGLAECRDAAAQGSTQAQSALYAGLFRMAYNHWHAAAALDSFPGQSGVFRQGFAEGEGGNAPNMIQMEDQMWMANGEQKLTIANLRPSIISTEISSDKGTDNMDIYFTPTYGGHLSALLLHIYYNISGASNSGLYIAQFYQRNELIGEVSGDMGLTGNGGRFVSIPLDYPLHPKERYRIHIQMIKLDFVATISLDKTMECLKVTGYQIPSAVVRCPLPMEEASQGGLFLVHHNSYGTGAELTLTWDGEVLSPMAVRTVTDKTGRIIEETEFRLAREISPSSNAQLKINCNNEGDFSLYDWGAVLI